MSVNGEIQTPLGTFGISTGVSFVEQRYAGVRTLTVETARHKVVYRLEQGHPYSINLPSDENGDTQVIYSGTDDNLTVRIPNPTNETVAELKEKLKEERDARAHAEAPANVAPESQEQDGHSANSAPSPQPMATPSQELTRE